MNLAKIYVVTLTVVLGAAVIIELSRTVPVFHILVFGAVAWFGSKLFGS